MTEGLCYLLPVVGPGLALVSVREAGLVLVIAAPVPDPTRDLGPETALVPVLARRIALSPVIGHAHDPGMLPRNVPLTGRTVTVRAGVGADRGLRRNVTIAVHVVERVSETDHDPLLQTRMPVLVKRHKTPAPLQGMMLSTMSNAAGYLTCSYISNPPVVY